MKLPIRFASTLTAAIFGGFLLGGIREVEQYKNVDLMLLMLRDRLQDAMFFALGALVVYHFAK